jgi:hypothetical protein
VGDAIREVVWTLFTYGGCNKGGSSIFQSFFFGQILADFVAFIVAESMPKLRLKS